MLLKPLLPLPESAPTQTGLLVFDYEATPPHIALLVQQTYYALTYHGSEMRPDLELLWKKRLIHIPRLLYIALDIPLSPEHVKAVFHAYKPLQPGDSCLNPIVRLCEEFYTQKVQAPFLKGFLEWLNGMQVIQSFHANPVSGTTQVELPEYGRKEIDDRIAALLSARKN